MCILLNHEKITLPIQDILFSLGHVCVGKILNLYFRGKFDFFGGQFSVRGKLKSVF